jgi:hypothetical protein
MTRTVELHLSSLILTHIERVATTVLRRIVLVDKSTLLMGTLEATNVHPVSDVVKLCLKLLRATNARRPDIHINVGGSVFLNLFDIRSLNLLCHSSSSDLIYRLGLHLLKAFGQICYNSCSSPELSGSSA